MSGSGFQWVVSPKIIADGLEEYARRVEVGLYAIAQYWGQKYLQDPARKSKTWHDRSGAARGGLFFAVDGLGMGTLQGEISEKAKPLMSDVGVEQGSKDTLIVTLGHTVFYGKYLELSNGGKHAVIMSTIESALPDLERLLRDSGFEI
jgi:hypothetical protein